MAQLFRSGFCLSVCSLSRIDGHNADFKKSPDDSDKEVCDYHMFS